MPYTDELLFAPPASPTDTVKPTPPMQAQLPTLRSQMNGIDPETEQKKGFVLPALKEGYYQNKGAVESGLAAINQYVGRPNAAQEWQQAANEANQTAAQVGRQDLNVAPWSANGGGLSGAAPWAAYQITKNLPYTLGLGGAGGVAAGAARVAGLGALGETAAGLAGTAAAAYPGSVGSVYENTDKSQQAAAQALAYGVPHAALDIVEPSMLRGMVSGKSLKNLGESFIKNIGKTAGAEGATEAVQQGIEESPRNDLTPMQRINNMVDAGITGAVVGMGMGGGATAIGKLREIRNTNPSDVTNDALKEGVDQGLSVNQKYPLAQEQQSQEQAQQPQQPLQEPAQTAATPSVSGSVEPYPAGSIRTSTDLFEANAPALAYNPPSAPTVSPEPAAELESVPTGPTSALNTPPLKRQDEKYFEKLPGKDVAEKAATLFSRLSSGDSVPQYVERLAQHLGFLDQNKQPVDLAEAATTARQDIESAIANGASPQTMATLQQRAAIFDAAAETQKANTPEAFAPRESTAEEPIKGEVSAEPNLTAAPETKAPTAEEAVTEPSTAALTEENTKQTEAPTLSLDEMTQQRDTLSRELTAQGMLLKSQKMLKSYAESEGITPTEARKTLKADLAQRETLLQQLDDQIAAQPAPVANEAQAAPNNEAQTTLNGELPVSEEPNNAFQEPSPESVLSREPSPLGGSVGEGNAQGAASEKAPRRRGRPIKQQVNEQNSQQNGQPNGEQNGEQNTQQNGQPNGEQNGQINEPSPQLPPPAPPQKPGFVPRGARPGETQQQRKERLAAETAAYEQRRSNQIQQAYAANAQRGGVNINAGPKEKSPAQAFLKYREQQGGKVRFRANEGSATSMTGKAFDVAFDRIVNKLGPGLRNSVKIVETAEDLPQHIKDGAAAQKFDYNKVHGVIDDNGDVYVVKGNARSEADLQDTIFHEVLGHKGAAAAFGSNHENVMASIFDRAGGFEGLSKIAKKFGVETELRHYTPQGRELTDTDKADLADEFLAQLAGGATGKTKTALMEFAGRIQRAVVSMLRSVGMNQLANRFAKMNASEVAATLRDMREAVTREDAATPQMQFKAKNETLEKLTKTFGEQIEKFPAASSVPDMKARARKTLLYWSSFGHINDVWGHLFGADNASNPLNRYAAAQTERATTTARMSQMFRNAYDQFTAYEKSRPKVAEAIVDLMKFTEFGIDPGKTWGEQVHLHGLPNSADLKEKVRDAQHIRQWLKQNERPADKVSVYDKFKAVNDALYLAQMDTSLYNLVATDPAFSSEIKNANKDPLAAFNDQATLHEDPQKSRDYWAKSLKDRVDAVQKYIDDRLGTPDKKGSITDPEEQEKFKKRVTALELRIKDIASTRAAMERFPNFHLGRNGEYFISFEMRGTEKDAKVPEPEVVEKVAAALRAADIGGVQVTPGTQQRTVFIRTETLAQRDKIEEVTKQLEKDGLLQEGTKYLTGTRSDSRVLERIAPDWLEKYIQNIRASNLDSEAKDMLVSVAREQWVDMLPDTALSKVLITRNAVPGYNPDMIRNFGFRAQLGINALANMATAGKTSDAFSAMRSLQRNAQFENQDKRADSMIQVIDELSRREMERPQNGGRNWIDSWRSLNHAYHLGASASYVLTNLTQPGVLLWPELAAKYGYMKSAKAIAKVTPTAFRIIEEVFKEGKSYGGGRWADAIVTAKALEAAKLDDNTREFVQRLINNGNIDLGSPSRELSRVSEGTTDSKADRLFRYSSSIGYYSEVFNRLAAGLAARELYGDKEGVDGYANRVINQSMLQYSDWYTNRASSKQGVAGQFSPVALSFQQYSMQVMEKLYRETSKAFLGQAKTDAEKKEARRYLAAHALAIQVVAGTLGMPMANVIAAAVDKLRDLWDDDEYPHDSKADLENLFADMLGKDMAQILTRGLPRAFNFDMSTRAGEQDMFPLSKFLTDRRSLEDAAKEMAYRNMGAPFSMGVNIASGMQKMAEGNILEGMQQLVPVALKGPIAAYRANEAESFTTSKGKRLNGGEPGVGDAIVQSLGFTPAQKAAVTEANSQQTIRRALLTERQKQDRREAVEAIRNGGLTQDQLTRLQQRDQTNPAYAVLPTIGAAVRKQLKDEAQGRALGVPYGANIKDQRARSLTRWATEE